MGITQFIDPFYKYLDKNIFRNTPTLGQICWAPICHREDIPRILDVERADPTEHFATKFEIRNMVETDFMKKNRLPIKVLNLRETEELVVTRTKLRQAIIVANRNTVFTDFSKPILRKCHLQENSIMVVPLYGVESQEHEGGYPPIMVARIKGMLFNQLFYCPKNSNPLVYEAVARIDRLQTLRAIYPTYRPDPIALSDEALSVLLAMIRQYFGAAEDDDMRALRELSFETIPLEARPRGIVPPS